MPPQLPAQLPAQLPPELVPWLSPELRLPEPPPLGPASRYAGLSAPELWAWSRRLSACADLWTGQARRFVAMGVTPALGGPCADALLEAHRALLTELRAIGTELEQTGAGLRRGSAA